MNQKLPLRPEQRRALLGMALLILLASAAWAVLDAAGDDFDERIAATLIRDDATWLQQSIEHHLGHPLAFTERRAGPAGLEAGQLGHDEHVYRLLFRDDATRIDVAWPRDVQGAVAVLPAELADRFDASVFEPDEPDDADDTGDPGDDDGDDDGDPASLTLPYAELEQLVARGDSRKRATLSILAFAIRDHATVLDEYGFAMERYARLLDSMIAAIEEWRRLTPDTPLPDDLQPIHDSATRLRGEMAELGALLRGVMAKILDTDLTARTRGRYEEAYNTRIPDVNGYLAATSRLVDRFITVGRRYELGVDDVLAEHRDILDTLFDIRVAPNETWQRVSQILLLLAVTMTIATFVLLVVFNRLRLPSVVRREMTGFGLRDARLLRELVNRYRQRWFRERDVRSVLVAMRHDIREWVKQHRDALLFGFDAALAATTATTTDDSEGAAAAVAEPTDAAVAEADRLDKRQARRRRREEREAKRDAGAVSVISLADRQLETLLQVLRAADFDLYDLENVPAPRQQELARYIPEARRQLPRRLWRRWCRDFVGSDEETWEPFLRHARKGKWDALREDIDQRDATGRQPLPAPASPTATGDGDDAGETPPRVFEGEAVVVIGGNPWMRNFYTRAVTEQLGARTARWFDGSQDVSRLDRLGADVVIMLYKGLSHGTSRRVTARAVPGRQARIIFSDHPGRSRFVASILDSPAVRGGSGE